MKTNPLNLNLIVDIGKIQRYYAENYCAIKHVLFTYVTVLLSKNLLKCHGAPWDQKLINGKQPLNSDRKFPIFKVEDEYYDYLLYNLVNGFKNEESVTLQSLEVTSMPTQLLLPVLNDLHDNLDRHFESTVASVMANQPLYTGKSVLMNVTLINQHTLIVSLKTVSDDIDMFKL